MAGVVWDNGWRWIFILVMLHPIFGHGKTDRN
jgi:hypothetical protein